MSEAADTARRQTLALVLLPALLLAAVWLLALRPGLVREVDATDARLQETRAQMPSTAALSAQLDELATLRAELEAAREARQASSQEPAARPSGADRAARRLKLSEIFARHSLVLVSEGAGVMDATPHLQRTLGSATRRIPTTTLHLEGRYLDVLAVLRSLETAGLGVVPVRLELSADRALSGELQWKLVIA